MKSQPAANVSVKSGQVRAFWAARQGLSAPIRGGAAEVVHASGWIYTPGSTLPYLVFRSRLADFHRSAADRALFDEKSLVEVPTVRGCTMLVRAEDAALALTVGGRFLNRHLERVRTACGIGEREVRDLSEAVPTLLRDGPLPVESLRSRLPDNLVRDLGSVGKALGERSTLTFALRLLQLNMIVQRVAADRRLDSQTYAYQLMPRELGKKLSQEEADVAVAHLFFGWAAPATLREFAWWSGMSQKEARAVVDRIGLVPISVEDWAGEAWIPPRLLGELRKTREEDGRPAFSFLPVRDNYLYFRRGLGIFLDRKGRETTVLDWRCRPAPLGGLETLHHNAILEGDRLAGYWEYDPDEQEVVWQTCGTLPSSRRKKVEAEIARLQDFIRAQLTDVAFYAFDGGKNRRQRIDSLR